MMIHCAREACNNYTGLPDADWIAIVPAAETAIVNRATFCCARCAVLWLENAYMKGLPL